MIERFHHRGWHHFLLVVISGLMFFLNLGGPTLWDIDEGRNAECAFEMMEANNWIVPTFNSELRAHKPVLLYWLQILSYLCFGVNEFAARFPSALAALGTVLLTYELARSMFSRATGLLAGVIVATTPMLIGAARFANPDALLNFSVVLTMAVFWFGVDTRRWWWFVLLGGAAGLAFLAKGPVGVVLPGAIFTLFLLWQRQSAVAWDSRWLLTLLAFFFAGLPWYIWVGIETKGAFLREFFLTHNLERGTSAMENHHGFPGYYLVVLLVGTAPWSFFLLFAWWYGAWSAIRTPWQSCQRWWSAGADAVAASSTDKAAGYRLLVCWIVVFVAAFSVAATKLPNYVLPALAPCAILIARMIERWRKESLLAPSWLVHGAAASLAVIGIFCALALALAGGVGEPAFLRGRYFAGLEHWSILGLIPVAAAIACFAFARWRQHSRVVVAFAVSAVLLLAPLAAFGSVVFNRYKAPQVLAEEAEVIRRGEDIRIGGWNVEHLPSLNFYVKRNVEHLQDEKAVVSYLASRLPVYVFMPSSEWQRLQSQVASSTRVVGRQHDMYHHTEIVVVTNR